eukprot:4503377-Amphidinium_carterae.1
MTAAGVKELIIFIKSVAGADGMKVVLLTIPGQRCIDLLKVSAIARGKLLLMPDPPREAAQESPKLTTW